MMRSGRLLASAITLVHALPAYADEPGQRRWLAGDHHVHSIYSARYEADPEHSEHLPDPVIGGDSSHTTLQNVEMARRFGLDWMVTTDHGGPRHSALNHDRAWPDVVAARKAVPDIVLFYGMEFDVPGGEHASLILPTDATERATLRDIESRFGKREAFPADPSRNTKARMIEALRYMAGLPVPPVLIANHPSRTATGYGEWGLHTPAEYQAWQEAAPNVVIGMEGAPGHQAARPETGKDKAHGSRGLYGGFPTMGGFDQMVARLGGAWDALLGRGLHWTITANSDSHGHWREGGADFWPGEYPKTWVFAEPNAPDILDGLRNGRVFVATGNLVDQLEVKAAIGPTSPRTATMGQTLAIRDGDELDISIRFRPARTPNAAGQLPKVDHLDLIAGGASGVEGDHNDSTRIVRRFTSRDFRADGEDILVSLRMKVSKGTTYLRVRGTNTEQGEPEPDVAGEDPWRDLWFYSNPIYLSGEEIAQ
ncbi:phosphoesterase [Novosphingobium kaempferiae]|uniref:phosphoesterase n=1 Tax=Novosphingobium kaempferiae TaxID=2896849 RepID=UPI001E365065|nr:phosphoesterase [Novosphingobium kaempferiae]